MALQTKCSLSIKITGIIYYNFLKRAFVKGAIVKMFNKRSLIAIDISPICHGAKILKILKNILCWIYLKRMAWVHKLILNF